MEPALPPSPAAPPRSGPGDSPLWYLLLLPLLLWQGWLTLSLFGGERPWERLLDDQPVLSGRHPLHLYHGYLGAQSLWDLGRLCCFDPDFQAGYLKTPVFDGGSRPAEVSLFLGGCAYRPAAYKVCLALCCLAVPLLLAVAARGVGLHRAGTCLATLLGQLVWWGDPCQTILAAGHLDLLLVSLAALVQAGIVLRFDRAPGVCTWLALLAGSWLGWFAQPLFFALLLPLVLVFYLTAGARHRLPWHLALGAALGVAALLNGFWLVDWVSYWWVRAPRRLEVRLLPHRTFHTLWDATLWGAPADRALALGLFGAALVGIWLFNATRQRCTARLLGLGMVAFLVLTVGGAVSAVLTSLETPLLLVPALLFAIPPAVYALGECLRRLLCWTGSGWSIVAVVAGLALAGVLGGHRHVVTLARRGIAAPPLVIGLNDDQRAVVDVLRGQTTPDARILWEERPRPEGAPHWSALLPLLTGREYLGGLDPDASIEYGYASLSDQVLAGRPLRSWGDADLDDFCRRYNVGWVVCWSPAAIERFRAWKGAEALDTLQDEGTGCLFRLRRTPSFALLGEVHWLHAERDRIVLGDAVPVDGQLVLSLHHQAGLRVSPSQVQVEPELDPYDPIPLVRLRLPGPVARITLTWGEP